MKLNLQEIKDYASTLDLVFSDEDAQDVLDTQSIWYGSETVKEAVDDYINAFGS